MTSVLSHGGLEKERERDQERGCVLFVACSGRDADKINALHLVSLGAVYSPSDRRLFGVSVLETFFLLYIDFTAIHTCNQV